MATRYFTLSAADINGGLGIDADLGSWLTTAYAAGEPVGVAAGCWLVLGLSLRRVLLAAVALFLAASALSALLPVFPVLLAGRGLMGLAAGAIMPLSILIQLRAYSLTWRPLAIGLYACATTMGPQLAAVLDDPAMGAGGWTALLWLSAVPGVAALLAGAAGLWRDPIRWRPFIHADLGGLASLSTALALLACGFSQGNRLHWGESPAIIALLAGGTAALALFVLHERRHLRHPVVFLGLTRRWNLTLGAVGTLPLQLAAAFSGTLVPGFLAGVRDFRPQQIAPSLMAVFWPQLLGYPACVLVLRYRLLDPRACLVLGLCCVALGAVCDWPLTGDWEGGELLAGQVLQGVGLPLIILPLLVLFVGEVTPMEGAYAASIFNICRSLSGTIVGAWMATALRLDGQARYAELLANTGFYPYGHRAAVAGVAGVLTRIGAGGGGTGGTGADGGLTHLRAVQVIATAARRQAAVLGTVDVLVATGVLLLASCGVVLAMAAFGSGHPQRRPSGERLPGGGF